MIVIACVDDRMGLSFCGRRQSSDRLLRQDVLQFAAGRPIWMDTYTAAQFSDCDPACLRTDEAFLSHAGSGELCFVERQSILPWKDEIEGVVLYRWNRSYPSTVSFDLPLRSFICTERVNFSGFSHELITREVYVRDT